MSPKSLWILVDYGNVNPIDRDRGLAWLVDRILRAIGSERFQEGSVIKVRLYGGWYQESEFSRLAQLLSAEIASGFPAPFEFVSGKKMARAKVNVELAESLLTDPSRSLFRTYRPRGFPGGIRCSEPPFDGCAFPDACVLESIHPFLSSRECPVDGCSLSPKKILERPEQKLVDTMLTADLVQLSLEGERVAVVSSDDDLWPGIRLALNLGVEVFHVHPKKGQGSPPEYRDPAPSAYSEFSFY